MAWTPSFLPIYCLCTGPFRFTIWNWIHFVHSPLTSELKKTGRVFATLQACCMHAGQPRDGAEAQRRWYCSLKCCIYSRDEWHWPLKDKTIPPVWKCDRAYRGVPPPPPSFTLEGTDGGGGRLINVHLKSVVNDRIVQGEIRYKRVESFLGVTSLSLAPSTIWSSGRA